MERLARKAYAGTRPHENNSMLLSLLLLCKALVNPAFAQEGIGPKFLGGAAATESSAQTALLLNDGKLAGPLLRFPILIGHSLGIQSQAVADSASQFPLAALVGENQAEYRLQRARLIQ